MKKKLLFVLPMAPFPLSTGGNQAIYNGIQSLKNDFEIHVTFLLSRSSKKRNQTFDIPGVSVIPFIYKRKVNLFGVSLWLFSKLANFFKFEKKYIDYSFELIPARMKPLCQEFISFINEYVKENNIDVVQFEMLSCLPLVLTLPANVKKVFVHHELGFVVSEQKINMYGNSEYRKANVEIAKILEINLLNKCDAVITLSDIDKQKIADEGVNVPVFSSFAVVNTNAESHNPNNICNVLTFVGPAAHTPNYMGVKWFLENCWAKILDKDSSYTLKIIGNWPEDKRNELNNKYTNIQFLGFVPSLAEALNNTIMIVPIMVGSGIRMKILEAASLEIPFVSTSVGAEGLPFESGRDCFKADSPESFVKAIFDLNDKSLREKFTQNANAIVKEKYSVEALRKNRLEIYDVILK